MAKEGRKISLDKKKIDKLFNLIQDFDGDKFVASKLNIRPETFLIWKRTGKELYAILEDKLYEIGIFDIELEQYEEEFENMLPDVEADFLAENRYSEITYKNKDKLSDYISLRKDKYLEPIVYDFEYNILKKTKFFDDEQKNNDAIMYLLFYRVYERAKATASATKYLFSYQRNAKLPTNMKFAENMLKKYDRDSFGEEPQVVSHKHTGEISLINGMLEHISKQQLPENKNLLEDKQNIIDAEYEFEDDE